MDKKRCKHCGNNIKEHKEHCSTCERFFKLFKSKVSYKECKKELGKLLSEYFWVIGLGLVVVGVTKIWTNPIGIFLAGVILLLFGVFVKVITKNV